jgi:hypothetical protein
LRADRGDSFRFQFRPDGTADLTVKGPGGPVTVPATYTVLQDAPYAFWGVIELTFAATVSQRDQYRDAVRGLRRELEGKEVAPAAVAGGPGAVARKKKFVGEGLSHAARNMPEELPDRLRLQARMFQVGLQITGEGLVPHEREW